MPANCCVCNKPLVGKQTRFCCISCKNHLSNTLNNSIKKQKERGLKRKIDFINRAGGKCSICGYNKNRAALCFHHLDPTTKEFDLSMRTLSNNSLETLSKELDKCILVCHNCHMELHYPNK